MKVLHLTLKKKWFDMIASGEKKEEYREMKPYWRKRLVKDYDIIRFKNGYGKNVPTMDIEFKGVQSSLGIIEWGAPEKETVYILPLGKILSIKNYNKNK
jgi:hypothetical protein